MYAKVREVEVGEDLEGFSLGWWGSCVETVSTKVENGLFQGKKKKEIKCEKSLCNE